MTVEEQLQKVAVEIDKARAKRGRASSEEERVKISEQIDKLEHQKKDVVDTLADKRLAETERLAAEEKSAVTAERERILTKTKNIVAKGSPCPECGKAGEPCPGLPVPQFFNAGFVGKVSPRDWWIDWTCTDETCGNRWRVWPDKEGNDQ